MAVFCQDPGMTNEFEYQTGIVGAGWLGLPLARHCKSRGNLSR